MFERGRSKDLSENRVTYREGVAVLNTGGAAGLRVPPESALHSEVLLFLLERILRHTPLGVHTKTRLT